MDVILGNQLNQSQQLNLTPKIIDELKVLQMSNLELEQFIENAIVDNPLLEEEEHFDTVENLIELKEDGAEQNENDELVSEYKTDFTTYVNMGESLKVHLMTQLKELNVEPVVRKAAAFIIESLDENGYFRLSIKKSAGILNVSEDDMKAGIRCIQSMEPSGIGARDLKECLIIQIRNKGMFSGLIKNIIMNHLEAISERKYKQIAKTLCVSVEEVVGVHNIIRMLNPKPGMEFSLDKVIEYIKPELEVRNIDGNFIVMFIDNSTASLRINHSYLRLLKSENCNGETVSYIKSKLSKALEILQAINKRRKTVISIANVIVEHQAEFFLKGYNSLKPLTMKLVADSLGIHESTVSRTVNGKYIQTPKGIFELRFFFSSALDESVSSNGVKDMIKKIVAEEDKSNPLNDERIKKALELKGVIVARRTISKYREELSILPALKRKV